MPRANYIFIKHTLFLCNIMLFCSLILFASVRTASDSVERINLAYFALETPAAILIIALIALCAAEDHRRK